MYIRYNLSVRARENIAAYKSKKYPNIKVTNGYVLSKLLENFEEALGGVDMESAFIMYKQKEECGGISTNVNMTAKALESISRLKLLLEKKYEEKFFPAQIIDFILICALSEKCEKKQSITDEQLLIILLRLAYLLSKGQDIGKVRDEIAEVVVKNNLLQQEEL